MAYSTGIMEEQERRGSGNEREEKQKIRNARKAKVRADVCDQTSKLGGVI
jgi:hypothetical protein